MKPHPWKRRSKSQKENQLARGKLIHNQLDVQVIKDLNKIFDEGIQSMKDVMRALEYLSHSSTKAAADLVEALKRQEEQREALQGQLIREWDAVQAVRANESGGASQDVPVVNFDYQYGYRAFRPRSGGFLYSTAKDSVWWPQSVKVAECLRASMGDCNCPICRVPSPHFAPQLPCSCGIYATYRLDELLIDMARFVLGKIRAKGTIIHCATGFRAEQAEIEELYCAGDCELMKGLGVRYQVPVVGLAVGPSMPLHPSESHERWVQPTLEVAEKPN